MRFVNAKSVRSNQPEARVSAVSRTPSANSAPQPPVVDQARPAGGQSARAAMKWPREPTMICVFGDTHLPT
jgi:hypothetical protein